MRVIGEKEIMIYRKKEFQDSFTKHLKNIIFNLNLIFLTSST